MKLFDEMPCIKGDRLLLRPLEPFDESAVKDIADNKNVYKYLPAFLFEQKYDDRRYMIERIEKECFAAGSSILLGICQNCAPEKVIGIAEIYNYEPQKEKASIGYRLNENYWRRGIASETVALLKNYLCTTDVRKITAHVMVENKASGRVLEKNGFIRKWTFLTEDWGRPSPVTVDKYIFKK